MTKTYTAREEKQVVLTVQAHDWADAERQVRAHYASLDRSDYTERDEGRPIWATVCMWRGDDHREIEVEVGPPEVPPTEDWAPCYEPEEDDRRESIQWHVPPECGGQIIEVSYCQRGDVMYRRCYDRSDRSVAYARRLADDDEPEPWDREPR